MSVICVCVEGGCVYVLRVCEMCTFCVLVFWCLVLVCAVVCVVCVCVVRLGMRKTPPCVDSKRLRVCVQDASVCTGKTPACVEHADVFPVHTEAS